MSLWGLSPCTPYDSIMLSKPKAWQQPWMTGAARAARSARCPMRPGFRYRQSSSSYTHPLLRALVSLWGFSPCGPYDSTMPSELKVWWQPWVTGAARAARFARCIMRPNSRRWQSCCRWLNLCAAPHKDNVGVCQPSHTQTTPATFCGSIRCQYTWAAKAARCGRCATGLAEGIIRAVAK